MDDPNKGEEVTSPSPSDEIETPSDDFDFNETLDETPSKKSAEARINELVAKNKEISEQLKDVTSKLDESKNIQPVPTPTPTPQAVMEQSPEVKKAVEVLKKEGFVTTEDVEAKLREVEDRRLLDGAHQTLELKYGGEDGRPKYDRSKIEETMKARAIYDPEVAYKALYETELLDFALKQAEEEVKPKPFSERAGSSGGQQLEERSITRAKIAKAMETPAGRAWYERNQLKILDLMAKGQVE